MELGTVKANAANASTKISPQCNQLLMLYDRVLTDPRVLSKAGGCKQLDGGGGRDMLNYMVKFNAAPLDRTFAALADPTRRALLTRLAEQPGLSVSALAEPFGISLPAIMKHLDVLAEAGLLARRKSGRTVACQLNAAPMQELVAWLNRYERFWSEALNRLAAFLEEEEDSCPSDQPSNRASPSSGGSRRPPPKSSPPGPIRKR